MKKVLKSLAVVGTVFTMASCTVTSPLAVSKATIGEERGESKTISFLTIELNGNYGVEEAVKKGNITGAVATIDEKVTNYVLFQKKTMIVSAKN